MSAKDLGILWLWVHGGYCLFYVSSGLSWFLTLCSVFVVGVYLVFGD